MKMAKASKADLDMAMTLGNYMDAIEGGQMPDALSEDKESIEFLDSDDCEQYSRLLNGLQRLLNQGSICRVIWGMAVVCDPSNKCIDPNADTLEIHPDHVKAHEQRDELLDAAKAFIAAGDRYVEIGNDDSDDIGIMLEFAEAEDALREAIAKATGSET